MVLALEMLRDSEWRYDLCDAWMLVPGFPWRAFAEWAPTRDDMKMLRARLALHLRAALRADAGRTREPSSSGRLDSPGRTAVRITERATAYPPPMGDREAPCGPLTYPSPSLTS